jgi:hypothetical protein
MRKLLILPILLFLLFPFSAIAFAAPVHPAGFTCSHDVCDGLLPHDTDGGSNCTSNITEMLNAEMIDSHNNTVAYIRQYVSNNCNAVWSTVFDSTMSFHNFTVWTNRASFDDNAGYGKPYSGPGVNGSFQDGGMVGCDSEAPRDSIGGRVDWYDHYNVLIHTYLNNLYYC